MNDDTKTLERVGGRVAGELGEGLSDERRALQRRAFLAAAASIAEARNSSRAWRKGARLTAAAAAAAFAIAATAFLAGGAEPIPFWVGEQRVAGAEGGWIESRGADAVPVVFDNGSRFELRSETSVRVTASNTDRVAVSMNGGELLADIRRSGGTKWEVNAGPYRVAVLGTAFTVDWNEGSGKLAVAVSRGVVHVRGGHLNEYGIRIAAGKRLVVDGPDGRVAVEAIGEEAPAPAKSAAATTSGAPALPSLEPVAPGPEAGGAAAPAWKPASRGTARAPKLFESWKALYERRDYAAAVAAAETEGIDSLLGRLDIEDLWRLANASRFAHRGDVARRALLAVRARFADTPRASTAAFLLGRTELEDRANPGIARGWFETYLREAGDGPLAEEALGRLMEACDKAGSAGDAKRYAERYLSRYEDGLFAALAKSILSR